MIVVVGEVEVSGCRRGLPDPADHRKQRDQREGVRGSQLARITEIGIKPREDGRLRRALFINGGHVRCAQGAARFAVGGHNDDAFRYRVLVQHLHEDQPFFGQESMAMANRLRVS